ncbi:hypothetical protein L1987_58795 [Smallanthus sonchifolius]|uniref:Uncharacterized protein n=1 Tax=Smallanthus sonchifolius TaxID=185202 RepID=A0ACB9D3D3_9ASTR|nr:hypothetical protein L1987_58795 [Smallanthus sonchifolius]
MKDQKSEKVGEDRFGTVYRCTLRPEETPTRSGGSHRVDALRESGILQNCVEILKHKVRDGFIFVLSVFKAEEKRASGLTEGRRRDAFLHSGLGFLQDLGVLHRNLKQENLLVDIGREILKIADLAPEVMMRLDYFTGLDMWSIVSSSGAMGSVSNRCSSSIPQKTLVCKTTVHLRSIQSKLEKSNKLNGSVFDYLDGFEGQSSKLMSLFWSVIRQLAEIEAMATSKKVITSEEWEKKLNDVKIRKEDMNKLVMNFLVTEGYVDAAEKFRMESGTEPDIDLATITDRMAVKKAVQSGNVEDAIEKVNDLNPEILDTNPQLFFHLQQQRLIELIRNGKVEEALEFAQEELAPRGEENQSFLEELERTVALLAFEDVKNSPVGDLLDISQRLKTASEVNAAILTSQSHEKDPKLPSLLRMLLWAQNQLDEKAVYPRITDLFTATLEDPSV